MKTILLFGAGKSATYLISYLINEISNHGWQLIVCDANKELAASKIGSAENAETVSIDVEDDIERNKLIMKSDIVISMLPPALHFLIAKDCIEFGKNLLTASYVDKNIRSLEKEISGKRLLFLCEMGLDPGIDHMSAMSLVNSIKKQGGLVTSFISHCGGLIAPENDNNPWHYKITWNPRNIVLAGKDGAEYLNENQIIKTQYKSVFDNCPAVYLIDNYPLCWYPNRDSLHYIELYGLKGISTFIRTTLRHPVFCKGWNWFVNSGLTDTDDHEQIKECNTFKQWFDVKSTHQSNIVLQTKDFKKQISFLGLESNDMLPYDCKTSADILQYLLEKNLPIQPDDKDIIVMLHEVEYEIGSKRYGVRSSLIEKGEDSLKTAMAKTVGLPLGIAAKLILQGKIKITGLHIPIIPEIYSPVMAELEDYGIIFTEQTSSH